MIPVRRRPLPPELSDRLISRTQALGSAPDSGSARTAWRSARAERRELKAALGRLAHRPSYCMYCLESFGTDVDHYRPLLIAPHLAFVWENHLLACGTCNQSSKREHFPLGPGGDPLLLDPTHDDPGEHLTVAGSGHLVPLTDKGQATIEVLRLNDRPSISGARAKVLLRVQERLRRTQDYGRDLAQHDVDDLEVFSHVDVLHLFAHAVRRGDLARIPRTRDLSDYAIRQLPAFRTMFPLCAL